MKKKIFAILILLVVILSCVVIPKIQAGTTEIATVKNTSLKPEEKANVFIDLSSFTDVTKVVLTTSIYLEPLVDLSTGVQSTDTQFDNKVLTISNISTQSIYVSYTIPAYIASGTVIKLEVVGYDEEDEEKAKSTIEITVAQDQNNNQIPGDQTGNGTGNNQDGIQNSDQSNSSSNMQVSSAKTQSLTGSTTTTATYKGSRNNYLTGLSVNGYELNPSFNKTNHTYFITVGNDVTSVSVSTEKDDSSATVTVSGNTNLKVGLNKVLVSVLAKNGDVRYYRIYVTRQG